MAYVIIKIYNFLVGIWSFVVNSIYWVFHFLSIKNARHEKSLVALQMKHNGIDFLPNIMMHHHQWTSDGILADWRPWIVTMIDRGSRDDCDGAAYLARWLLSIVDRKSRIVTLMDGWKFWGAHVVCYCPGLKLMVSNSNVVYFTDDNWKKNIWEHFKEFGRDYNVIV